MVYFSNPICYEQALGYKSEKVKRLSRSQFLMDSVVDGVRYRAKTGDAGLEKGVKRLSNAMLCESIVCVRS